MILPGCGSPRTTGKGDSSLETAVSYYIDGDLASAESLFQQIIQRPGSDEDLQTAYLYLGRIYMSRGDYERAAEAFSSGKLVGGDIRFDEYLELASRRSGVSAAAIARAACVTRGQLAALMCAMFGDALESGQRDMNSVPKGTTVSAKRDGERAGVDIEAVVRAGVMDVLPDGQFYPDEKVTRPSFFVIASRVGAAVGLGPGVMQELFPGGYRGTLVTTGRKGSGAEDTVCVSGREVVDGFERIASAAGL